MNVPLPHSIGIVKKTGMPKPPSKGFLLEKLYPAWHARVNPPAPVQEPTSETEEPTSETEEEGTEEEEEESEKEEEKEEEEASTDEEAL